MARRDFPALGFDPAPGEPIALADAARSVGAAGRVFAEAAERVARLNSTGWSGEAADAFRTRLADLPRDLDLAARSHRTAARQLDDYSSGLALRQRRADELERRAEELRRQQPTALAETDLAAVVATARRLYADHRAAGASVARAIREAANAPYEKPGRLSRALHAAKDWVARHADVLVAMSTVLKGVSAVLGVLCLVPGLTFLAPFALLTAGLALVVDVGMKLATGEGSWTAIGLDAALTFVPGGKLLSRARAARGAVAGRRTLATTGTGARVSGGTVRPRAGGGHSPEAWDWADEAYADIRASDDVGAVARSVREVPRATGGRGFRSEDVADVKRHVFVDEHLMKGYDGRIGRRRFDSDPDMAEAWLRLRGGRPLPQDVGLLEHELAELRYWRQNPRALYDEAHQAANRVADWESSVPEPTFENYRAGW